MKPQSIRLISENPAYRKLVGDTKINNWTRLLLEIERKLIHGRNI